MSTRQDVPLRFFTLVANWRHAFSAAVLSLALVFVLQVQPAQAMQDSDAYGRAAAPTHYGSVERSSYGGGNRSGGGYGGDGGGYGAKLGYLLKPFQYAFKAVGYALKVPYYALQVPIYALQVPAKLFAHKDGYTDNSAGAGAAPPPPRQRHYDPSVR